LVMGNTAHSNLCTAQRRGIHLTIRHVLVERGRNESKVVRSLIACLHASDAVHKEACDRVVKANGLQQQLESLAVVHECPQLDCLTEQPFDASSCHLRTSACSSCCLLPSSSSHPHLHYQRETERERWQGLIWISCCCAHPRQEMPVKYDL
jgi:hypothetical protein